MSAALERGPVDRAEWRWAIGWGLIIVLASCLPYLYANFAAPPGRVFGGFLVNYLDGNSYLAKMREGYDGGWLFQLAFTPEPQAGILVFTLYLGLGHLARLSGLPLILVFHIARAVCGVILLLTVYRLAAEITADRAARRWAFGIAAGGSGLALLSLLLGRSDASHFVPVDLLVPEAYGFYSLLANPHFCLAFALEGWAVLLVLRPPRKNAWLHFTGLAAAGLGVASMAPYLTPVMWLAAAAGITLARPLDRAMLGRFAVLVMTSGLLLGYEYWSMVSDPVIAGWARQNQTPTPPAADILLGLGIWLPLAALGIWRYWQETRQRPVLAALAAWLLCSLVLVFVPYALQRRFLGGIFVPMDVLAGSGLAWLLSRAGKLRWPAIGLTLVLGYSSSLLVLAALFRAPQGADPKLYLTSDEAAGLTWLAARPISGLVVLSDSRMGLFVPGWTGARSIYGHPMETLDATDKLAEVDGYFNSGDTAVFNRYPIRVVIGGPLPAGWHVAFHQGSMVIYER